MQAMFIYLLTVTLLIIPSIQQNYGYVSSSEIPVYIASIRELFHRATEADHLAKLEQLKTDWSAPFLEYYEQEIRTS